METARSRGARDKGSWQPARKNITPSRNKTTYTGAKQQTKWSKIKHSWVCLVFFGRKDRVSILAWLLKDPVPVTPRMVMLGLGPGNPWSSMLSAMSLSDSIGLKLWFYSLCFVWWVWVQDVQVNCWGEHVLRPLVFLDGRNDSQRRAPNVQPFAIRNPARSTVTTGLTEAVMWVAICFFLLRKSSCLMTWCVRMYMEVPDEQQMDHLVFSCQQDAEF